MSLTKALPNLVIFPEAENAYKNYEAKPYGLNSGVEKIKNEAKYLTYKGHIVFGKQSMPYFRRMPKEYSENEACFVFINRGEVSVRAPEEYIDLNEKSGVLAKCLNYYFETKQENRVADDHIEVIAVLLYPGILEQLFDFELATSVHSTNYDIKQVVINELLENFKRSVSLLIENPELADEKKSLKRNLENSFCS